MRRWLVFDVLLLAGLVLAVPMGALTEPHPRAPRASAVAAPVTAPAVRSEVIGHSVYGRPIRATRLGDAKARVSVLVVGCIHGSEPAGRPVIWRLRHARVPARVALWLIDMGNPDGCLAGTRQNAHGVDLNRQFPFHWQPLPRGTYYSGPRALSEPESRALYGFMRRERPAVSLWYHQHAQLVDWNGDANVARRYAHRVGLPARIFYEAPGSITRWQVHAIRGATGVVVELAAGSLSGADVRRHADAVLALAREARR